jgi:hypothetical protein
MFVAELRKAAKPSNWVRLPYALLLSIGQTFTIVDKVSAGAVTGTFAQGSTVGPLATMLEAFTFQSGS